MINIVFWVFFGPVVYLFSVNVVPFFLPLPCLEEPAKTAANVEAKEEHGEPKIEKVVESVEESASVEEAEPFVTKGNVHCRLQFLLFLFLIFSFMKTAASVQGCFQC